MRSLHRIILKREIECLRPMTNCCLVGDGLCEDNCSSTLLRGIFFISRWTHGPTQQHAHKQGPLTLIFFSCAKIFPISSSYKALSYVTIPASAKSVSTVPTGVLFVFSLSVLLQERLQDIFGTAALPVHCLCTAAAAQESLQGCSNSPGEQLSKLVKCFLVKPVAQLSTVSHISALNQTSPVPPGSWGVPGVPREQWLSSLGVHAGKSLPSLYCARSTLFF